MTEGTGITAAVLVTEVCAAQVRLALVNKPARQTREQRGCGGEVPEIRLPMEGPDFASRERYGGSGDRFIGGD